MARLTWQDVAADKKKQRQEKIPAKWMIPSKLLPSDDEQNIQVWPHSSGFFSTKQLEITESDASDVFRQIAAGKWKAEEVMEAVRKRASVAQHCINCVIEIYFEEAIARAMELDAYFLKEWKTVGPLHGLPVSFKDQFNIKGLDTSVGYVSWANTPTTEDSTLVTLLCAGGVIPFVKTNISATLMMGESVNNVFGRTVNPQRS